MNYPVEDLTGEDYDDGTMPANVADLSEKVVGRRIVSVEKGVPLPKPDPDTYYWGESTGTEEEILTFCPMHSPVTPRNSEDS